MRLRPYQHLIAWQEAHRLCVRIYCITKVFPKEERYGLISQMRRSSSSVPTNIAEGNAKRSAKEKMHYLEIAIGSLDELHYQCLLSFDLQYITQEIIDEIDNHLQRVGYLIEKLRSSLL